MFMLAGFGFIQPNGGDEEVFIHQANVSNRDPDVVIRQASIPTVPPLRFQLRFKKRPTYPECERGLLIVGQISYIARTGVLGPWTPSFGLQLPCDIPVLCMA